MDYILSTIPQLANAIKSIRKKNAYSQQDIAAQTGLLQKTISLLENKPDKSTIESLFKLISALNYKIVLAPKNKSGREW
ncbi:MAG: helix-turn-helix domain-containing protein [Spirochaetales bacterium]|nr:helix-turn-helix domain-containing protein [Spirochaetales bacterium]